MSAKIIQFPRKREAELREVLRQHTQRKSALRQQSTRHVRAWVAIASLKPRDPKRRF
jgi:hypothetical protein